MYTIYLPTKNKNHIRGYWIENGKLYKDNINQLKVHYIDKNIIQGYCEGHNQLALFFKNESYGFIFDNKTKEINILKNKKIFIWNTYKGLKNRIKEILHDYQGVTVYKRKNDYLFEVYYNETQ